MSLLIDTLSSAHQQIGDTWYIAKPGMHFALKEKLQWCHEILRGKAIAVHFHADESRSQRRW